MNIDLCECLKCNYEDFDASGRWIAYEQNCKFYFSNYCNEDFYFAKVYGNLKFRVVYNCYTKKFSFFKYKMLNDNNYNLIFFYLKEDDDQVTNDYLVRVLDKFVNNLEFI